MKTLTHSNQFSISQLNIYFLGDFQKNVVDKIPANRLGTGSFSLFNSFNILIPIVEEFANLAFFLSFIKK